MPEVALKTGQSGAKFREYYFCRVAISLKTE